MLLPSSALCGIMLGTASASHHPRDPHDAHSHEARKLKAHFASVERRVQSFQSKFTALSGETKPHFDKIKQACIITDMLGMGNPSNAEDQGNTILNSLDSVHSVVSNAASFPQGSATGSTVCTPQGVGGAQYAKAGGGSSPSRSQFIPAPPKTVTVTVTLGPNGNPIHTSPPSSPNDPSNPKGPMPGSPITLTITKNGAPMTTVVPGGLSPAAYSSLLNDNAQPTNPPGGGSPSSPDSPTTVTITLPDGAVVPLTAPPGVKTLTVEMPNGQTTLVPVPQRTGSPSSPNGSSPGSPSDPNSPNNPNNPTNPNGGSPSNPNSPNGGSPNGGSPGSPNDPNAPRTVTITLPNDGPTVVTITLPNGKEVPVTAPPGVRTLTVTLPGGAVTTIPVPAPTGGSPGGGSPPTTITYTQGSGKVVTMTNPGDGAPSPTSPPGGSPVDPNAPTTVTITLPGGQQIPVTGPPGAKTITLGCAGLFSGCLGHLTDCFSGLMGSMHYFSPDMQSKIKSKYANVHAAFGKLEDGANSHLPGFSQHVKQLNAHKPAANSLS
ncbi:hypothetical protein RQP46_007378 [Phenoliferia psychrophenolica]